MTTTTTQSKLVATEGVLRPRPYVTSGYRQHVEQLPEPNLSGEWSPMLEKAASEADEEGARSKLMLGMAVIAVLAVLATVGVVLWPQ